MLSAGATLRARLFAKVVDRERLEAIAAKLGVDRTYVMAWIVGSEEMPTWVYDALNKEKT